MSVVSMGASASMSKVRQAAAVTPGGPGNRRGRDGTAGEPGGGLGRFDVGHGGSSAVDAVRIRITAGGGHPTRAQTFPGGSYCGMKSGLGPQPGGTNAGDGNGPGPAA